MKANVLSAVSECDDGNFFSFCQFHIVVGSFQHWNVSAKFTPEVGGERNKSFTASEFHTSSKRSIMLHTDPQVASQSHHCNEQCLVFAASTFCFLLSVFLEACITQPFGEREKTFRHWSMTVRAFTSLSTAFCTKSLSW